MKVVLQEDHPSLGYVGEVVNVKPGYARNFLLPRGIAVEAASKRASFLRHQLEGIEAKKRRLKTEAETRRAELENMKLEFTLKIGKGGKSFGSISAKNIEEELSSLGKDFSRRQIKLAEPIKSGGEFRVQVQLHSEVLASVPVIVTAEVADVPKEEQEEEKKAEASEEDFAEEGMEGAEFDDSDSSDADDSDTEQ